MEEKRKKAQLLRVMYDMGQHIEASYMPNMSKRDIEISSIDQVIFCHSGCYASLENVV